MIQGVDVLRVALALVPVLLFLAALRALDSYKLISVRAVFKALAAGALAALLCFTITARDEISIGCSQGGKPDATKDEIAH